MVCMTKECMDKYIEKLEDSIAEYMEMPVSQRSAEAVNGMVEAWERIMTMYDTIYSEKLTEEDAKVWCANMKNSDGTTGAHWTISQTTEAGKPEGIDDYVWNAAMNMIYSDYGDTFQKYGVGTVEFYKEIAEDFLEDEDGPDPEVKIGKYYHEIVKG